MPKSAAIERSVTYREGRPAINVKLHVAGQDFWPDEFRSLPESADGAQEIGQTTAADIIDAACNIVRQMFWDDVSERAMATPLGTIYQDGRSGGWLVIEHDPTHGGENAPAPIWLASYTGLQAGVARLLAEAPRRVRNIARQIAMDEMSRSAVDRMFGSATPEGRDSNG